MRRGSRVYKLNGGHYSSSVDGGVTDTASYVSDLSHLGSIAITEQRYSNHSGSLPERNDQHLGNSILDIEAATECSSMASANTKQVNWFLFSRLLSHYVMSYHCINYLLCTHSCVTVTSLG